MLSAQKNFSLITKITCLAVSLTIAGCGTDILPETSIPKTELEPNDNFATAQEIVTNNANSISISGTLNDGYDTDIFNVGELSNGTKLTIEIKSSDSILSEGLTIALFDKDYDIAYLEDIDVSSYYQKAFTHIIRKAGTYFLGITSQDGYVPDNFSYDIRINKTSSNVPSHGKQIVYLDFNGANNISLGEDFYSHLEPFSQAINQYNDREIANLITNLVREDYKDFDIQIISSYDSSAPIWQHTTVYITGDDGEYLGLSEHLDWYNSDLTDYAVVFAGSFDSTGFTTEQYAQSIANVISHELGHLLGLIHTDDDTELMDEATPASRLAEDQDFHRAPIADFPIGWQDSIELLDMILGTN